MCTEIRKGTEEIDTVEQFRKAFPNVQIIPAHDHLFDNGCLCQIKVEETLDKAGIPHIYDHVFGTVIIQAEGNQ